MDLKKIRNYPLKHWYDVEASGLYAQRVGRYGAFPYHEDTEKLAKTVYKNVLPVGMFTPEFLVAESKAQKPRSIEQMFSEKFGFTVPNSFVTAINTDSNWYLITREDNLFGLFLLNEYMNQSEIDSYGDFIDLKGNEVYDEIFMNFKFEHGEYSKKIVAIFDNGDYGRGFPCMTVGMTTTRADLDVLRGITKDEMVRILGTFSTKEIRTELNNRISTLKSMLQRLRNKDSLVVTVSDVSNLVAKTSLSLMSSEYSMGLDKTRKIFNLLSDFEWNMTETTPNKNRILPYRFYRIFKKLDESIERFNYREYIAFIMGFMKIRWVVRIGGDLDQFVELFEKILEEDEEVFLNLVSHVSETVLDYNGGLPSFFELKKELENGDDLSLGATLTNSMIAKTEKTRNVSHDQVAFRNILNS